MRPADEGRLARLIAELDSDQFAARERASADLASLGEAAVPALRRALRGEAAAETHRRVALLLERVQWDDREPPADQLRSLRALEVLEWVGTPEARDVLARLAEGALEARLTQEAKASLERLARRDSLKP